MIKPVNESSYDSIPNHQPKSHLSKSISINEEESIYFEPCENSFELENIENNTNYQINSIYLHPPKNPEENIKTDQSNSTLKNLLSSNQKQPQTSLRNKKRRESLSSSNSGNSVYSNPEEHKISFPSKNLFDNIDKKFNSENKDKTGSFKYNSVSVNISHKIDLVHFDDINDSEIDLNFLTSKLRSLIVKSKNITNSSNKHFHSVIELQNFYIDNSPIWVIKFSEDGKYLATAGQKGVIKIFELLGYEYDNFKLNYKKSNIFSYLNLLKEEPKFTLNEHTSDVIDLAWSPHVYSYLLSASLDNYAILWDLSNDINQAVRKFQHGDMVIGISFSPKNVNVFISGCLDRFVRVWTINSDDKPEYFNIKEKITCVSYFPQGEAIAIGTHNGKVIIYNLEPKTRYNCSFSCRNRLGKNSFGKKVTNIEFIDKNSALVTTADSRLRYVSMPDGKVIHKYKGHVNEQSMIRAHNDNMNDMIISGSENGNCYVWSRMNKEFKRKKNYSYEYFKPFSKDIVECAVFANEVAITGYLKKFFKLTTLIFINSIIIIATDKGRLQVILNVQESMKI